MGTTVDGAIAGESKETLCRDPARIDIVLEEIRSYWHRNPDLRLAQIVGNAASRAGYGNGGYGMEDDVLLNNLRSVPFGHFDFNRGNNGNDFPALKVAQ